MYICLIYRMSNVLVFNTSVLVSQLDYHVALFIPISFSNILSVYVHYKFIGNFEMNKLVFL
jgi:hypothetical protein